MDLRNSTFIHSVFIFLCIGSVHSKKRKIKNDVTSDPKIDVQLNSIQLIKRYGYPFERHLVITDDGYALNMFRIPSNGLPVMLVHGIGDSSDCWLVLGPENSLAFLLADAGFDVWLFNARGNKYSKRHTGNISRRQYWNFSYEEMGSQDLPSTIDYILQVTSHNELTYIGFSQGTTIFFVMGSLRPEYNNKIKHAILLAPVAWVSNLKYPFIEILSQNLKQLTTLVDKTGVYELFSDNNLVNLYHAEVCNISSPAKLLCDLEFYVSYGLKNLSNLQPDRLPVISSHIPAGTSTKAFLHFIQGYSSKQFQRYTYYEPGKNTMVYGTNEPPTYNVSLVNAPVTIIHSKNDWYSNTNDVKRLKYLLPNIVNFRILNKKLDFTHLEFVYGSRVKVLVNDPIVSLLGSLK